MMTECASYGGRHVLPVKCMIPPPFMHTGRALSCKGLTLQMSHAFPIVL